MSAEGNPLDEGPVVTSDRRDTILESVRESIKGTKNEAEDTVVTHKKTVTSKDGILDEAEDDLVHTTEFDVEIETKMT